MSNLWPCLWHSTFKKSKQRSMCLRSCTIPTSCATWWDFSTLFCLNYFYMDQNESKRRNLYSRELWEAGLQRSGKIAYYSERLKWITPEGRLRKSNDIGPNVGRHLGNELNNSIWTSWGKVFVDMSWPLTLSFLLHVMSFDPDAANKIGVSIGYWAHRGDLEHIPGVCARRFNSLITQQIWCDSFWPGCHALKIHTITAS